MAMTEAEIKQAIQDVWDLHVQQLELMDDIIEIVEKALGKNYRKIPPLLEAEKVADRAIKELHHTAKVLLRGLLFKPDKVCCCSCCCGGHVEGLLPPWL